MRRLRHAVACFLLWASACASPELDTARSEIPDDRTLPPSTDSRSARAIYDEYFGQYLEQADFGWERAEWLTPAWVAARREPIPDAGHYAEEYHHYLDYNPFNYSRPGLTSDSFADPTEAEYNAALIATGDAERYWLERDPTEWMPAVATAYGRSAGSDVMASQFWYRATLPTERPLLERALELCPDCDDVFTPLSKNDIHKIFEIRFVRIVDDEVQVSRIFKVIGVDSSGSPQAHARNTDINYMGTLAGEDLRAKWRMEVSGLMNQRYFDADTVTLAPIPVIARISEDAVRSQYYDGRFDREEVDPDAYEREVADDEEGSCVSDCYAWACMRQYDLEGWYYWRNRDCTCSRDTARPAGALASGRCGAWEDGRYAAEPTSAHAGADAAAPPPLPEPEPEGDPPGQDPAPEEPSAEEEDPVEEDRDPTEEMEELCGNLELDGDEQCDTGEARSDEEPNACRRDCTNPRCGDGVIDSGEACDEGMFGNAACSPQCRVIDPDEEQPDITDEDSDDDDSDGSDDDGSDVDLAPTTAGCACSSGPGAPGAEGGVLGLVWLLGAWRRRRARSAR